MSNELKRKIAQAPKPAPLSEAQRQLVQEISQRNPSEDQMLAAARAAQSTQSSAAQEPDCERWISACPWCGASGPDFDESPMPSDICHHDPAEVQP